MNAVPSPPPVAPGCPEPPSFRESVGKVAVLLVVVLVAGALGVKWFGEMGDQARVPYTWGTTNDDPLYCYDAYRVAESEGRLPPETYNPIPVGDVSRYQDPKTGIIDRPDTCAENIRNDAHYRAPCSYPGTGPTLADRDDEWYGTPRGFAKRLAGCVDEAAGIAGAALAPCTVVPEDMYFNGNRCPLGATRSLRP
jgi:hypothetical protein